MWRELDPESGQPVEKGSRHVWLSSESLDKNNFIRDAMASPWLDYQWLEERLI
jgi:hypothetical protein